MAKAEHSADKKLFQQRLIMHSSCPRPGGAMWRINMKGGEDPAQRSSKGLLPLPHCASSFMETATAPPSVLASNCLFLAVRCVAASPLPPFRV